MQHSKYWVHGPHQLGFEQTFGEFIGGSFFAFSVGGGWLAVYIGVDRIIMNLGFPDKMDVWCIYGSNMWLLDIMKNKLTIIILYSEAMIEVGWGCIFCWRNGQVMGYLG